MGKRSTLHVHLTWKSIFWIFSTLWTVPSSQQNSRPSACRKGNRWPFPSKPASPTSKAQKPRSGAVWHSELFVAVATSSCNMALLEPVILCIYSLHSIQSLHSLRDSLCICGSSGVIKPLETIGPNDLPDTAKILWASRLCHEATQQSSWKQ